METHCNVLLRLLFLLVLVPSPSLADKALTEATLASFGFFSHLAGPQPFSSLSLIRRPHLVWVYFSNSDNLGRGGGLFEFLIPFTGPDLDIFLSTSNATGGAKTNHGEISVKWGLIWKNVTRLKRFQPQARSSSDFEV